MTNKNAEYLSLNFEQLDNDLHVVNFDLVTHDLVEEGGYIGIRKDEDSIQIEIFNKHGDVIFTKDLDYGEMI